MNKYTKYRFVPELNLIITSYHGDISMSDILQVTKQFTTDKEYNAEFDVLIDMKHCIGIAFRIELMDYVQYIKSSVKLKKKVKVGIVINTLNQEFLIKVYKGFGPLINMDIDYFRNEELCFEWMNFDNEQIKLIHEILESMKPENSDSEFQD